jgi:hypothetical protein
LENQEWYYLFEVAVPENYKYSFHWGLIGDLKQGRPNLGNTTRVEVYRLMQFTLRDVLEKYGGSQFADEIFYQAGLLAGKAFYHNILGEIGDFKELIHSLQNNLLSLNIGVLRVEEADLRTGSLILTVSEDLDCSGLPELDYEICVYDEGFIAGLLETYSGKPYDVKEIDCWCTGDRTCRFSAKVHE